MPPDSKLLTIWNPMHMFDNTSLFYSNMLKINNLGPDFEICVIFPDCQLVLTNRHLVNGFETLIVIYKKWKKTPPQICLYGTQFNSEWYKKFRSETKHTEEQLAKRISLRIQYFLVQSVPKLKLRPDRANCREFNWLTAVIIMHHAYM